MEKGAFVPPPVPRLRRPTEARGNNRSRRISPSIGSFSSINQGTGKWAASVNRGDVYADAASKGPEGVPLPGASALDRGHAPSQVSPLARSRDA